MENIRKAYGTQASPVFVIKGISLFIDRGEFVSIMGPSGSGKSTLAAILGCLATPTTGIYKLGDVDVTRLSETQLAILRNRSIGYIFQDFHLLDGMTAWENVALPLVYAGVSANRRKARALECLHAVGLSDRVNHHPKQLSGGQKQRVAIARSLVNNPSFLFADEATGALDKRTGQEILGIMQRLNLQGHTIIQVTHSREDANYSKRILHLVDGVIVKDEQVERPTIGPSIEREADEDTLRSRMWMIAESSSQRRDSDFRDLMNLFATSKSRSSILHAVRALAKWDRSESKTALLDVLGHQDWILRSEVVRQARKLGSEFGLKVARLGIDDANPWVRQTAVLEFKMICQDKFLTEDSALLMTHVNDEDERMRATIVRMLPQLAADEAIHYLGRALQDRDGRVRANALEAMFDLTDGVQNHIPILRTLLKDSNNRARANAAVLLGRFLPQEGFVCLCDMLQDNSNMMRASGAWGLGILKSEQAKDFLLDKLVAEKQENVISQIVRSLAGYESISFRLDGPENNNATTERLSA